MTTTSAFPIFVLFILFSACVGNVDKTFDTSINLKDTLYETHIYSVKNGDTIWQHYRIYFTPTDLTVDTSNFYYEASSRPWLNEEPYKIYFQREKVVALCDSMLSALSPYRNESHGSFYEEGRLYQHLKGQATNNKIDEAIFADELPLLLEHFNPLVINHATSDTPKYLIIKHEDVGTSEVKTYDVKTYNIKSKSGDTIVLSTGRLKEIELKEQ